VTLRTRHRWQHARVDLALDLCLHHPWGLYRVVIPAGNPGLGRIRWEGYSRMQRTIRTYGCLTIATAWSLALLTAPAAKAQLFSWTKEEMVEYTKAWTGERFPDGRPKVPDAWLARAKGLSQEEVIVTAGRGGGPANIAGYSQYDGNFKSCTRK